MTQALRSVLLSRQFARYLGVGVVNTLTGLSVIYAAKWLLGWSDPLANAAGYAVGLVVSFTLNSRWTFDYRGPRLRAMAGFLGVAAFSYLVNLGVVMLAIKGFGVNSYLAQALGVPPYTITSFLASRYLVFTPREAPAGADFPDRP